MFCPNCGTQLPDGAKFCPKCGAQVTGTVHMGVPGQGAQQENRGSQQGNGNAAGSVPTDLNNEDTGTSRNTNTGTYTDANTNADTNTSQGQNTARKSKKWIIPLVAIAAVIIVIAVVSAATRSSRICRNAIENYIDAMNLLSKEDAGMDEVKRAIDKMLPGSISDDLSEIIEIMAKSDYVSEDDIASDLGGGSGEKVRFVRITSAERIDQNEIQEVQDELSSVFSDSDFAEISGYLSDGESRDYVTGLLASETGLAEKDVDQLLDASQDLMNNIRKMKITDGYSVDFVVSVDGEEEDESAYVVRLDGKWVVDTE